MAFPPLPTTIDAINPRHWQTEVATEFCEVATTAMELLAAPYLTKTQGGFYTSPEAARARIEHLEGILTFLPYMAVVDAFQHWVYTHPDAAVAASNCDRTMKRWSRPTLVPLSRS